MKAKCFKFALFFLGMFLFIACNREDEGWAYYNQTQCADPWGAAQSETELLVGLANFFNDINVQTRNIVFLKTTHYMFVMLAGVLQEQL